MVETRVPVGVLATVRAAEQLLQKQIKHAAPAHGPEGRAWHLGTGRELVLEPQG